MSRLLTAGEKTVASQRAPIIPPTTATQHVGVAAETFSLPTRFGTLTLIDGQRFSVDAATKALLLATDRAITWET